MNRLERIQRYLEQNDPCQCDDCMCRHVSRKTTIEFKKDKIIIDEEIVGDF